MKNPQRDDDDNDDKDKDDGDDECKRGNGKFIPGRQYCIYNHWL